MDNENVISLTKINKTVAQAITDKNTKNKANIASLTNGGETDEEYWAENIRQFILDEVETSKKYTQDEIDYVERSLRETREAGHGDTANSEGGEEGHGNTVNSEGGEEGHGNTVSEGGERGHGYSVSESNVINLLKSMKGYLNGDGMNDEQLRCHLQNVREKYERTY